MYFLVHIIQDGLCFFHTLIPSWGFSIITFTATIRVLLFPLQIFNLKQQKKLQALKPDMDRLQKQFKDEPIRLYSERRRLMKISNINPLWMLLSSLIQLPIFLSMYKAIRLNQKLSLVSFAWLPNLAGPDPLLILPLLVAIVLWYQVGYNSTASPVAGLKYVMPALSFVFMVSLPAAVVLYSLTGNALQLLGQKAIETYC